MARGGAQRAMSHTILARQLLDPDEDIASLNRENLAKYDALIIYANTEEIGPDQEKALLEERLHYERELLRALLGPAGLALELAHRLEALCLEVARLDRSILLFIQRQPGTNTVAVAERVKAEVELYPGVQHGFAFPQRWCFDKPAAERHWERLFALYRRRLPA